MNKLTNNLIMYVNNLIMYVNNYYLSSSTNCRIERIIC